MHERAGRAHLNLTTSSLLLKDETRTHLLIAELDLCERIRPQDGTLVECAHMFRRAAPACCSPMALL